MKNVKFLSPYGEECLTPFVKHSNLEWNFFIFNFLFVRNSGAHYIIHKASEKEPSQSE